MTGQGPQHDLAKTAAKTENQAIAVGHKRPGHWTGLAPRDHEDDAVRWRSGDPVPITGSAGFGSTTVTITVSIPADASRSNFNLYMGQNNATPSTSTAAVATSAGQPAGNSMGTTVNYVAGQALTIQLTYLRTQGNTVTLSATIPAVDVSSGTNPSFVLA